MNTIMLLKELLGEGPVLEEDMIPDFRDDSALELSDAPEETPKEPLSDKPEVKYEEIPAVEEGIQVIEEKKESKIDARKMIIYSEIMKPKFDE